MTNLQHWRNYMRDVPSPEVWIDLAFYFMITSALQRRVWYYDRPLYTNLYIVNCGPPGTGKGRVTTEVTKALRHHKHPTKVNEYRKDENNNPEKLPYITIGAATTTFEGLLRDLSTSAAVYPFEDQTGKRRFYGHCSVSFILEELSSLFRLFHDQITKCLLSMYDCVDYEYKIKHGVPDIIVNPCVNILAGTTPSFLREAYTKGIFTDGFSSRCLFSFEHEKRNESFHISGTTDDQLDSWADFLDHLGKLLTVFGRLEYNNATRHFLESWYREKHLPKERAASKAMREYFVRKKVHLLKLAAAIHFADSLERQIPQEAFEKALEFLDKLEVSMQSGLSVLGRNQLSEIEKEIYHYIRSHRKVTKGELLVEFGGDVRLEEIEEILQVLIVTQKINAQTIKSHTQNELDTFNAL